VHEDSKDIFLLKFLSLEEFYAVSIGYNSWFSEPNILSSLFISGRLTLKMK